MLMTYANANADCELLVVSDHCELAAHNINSIEASGKAIGSRAYRSKEEHSIKNGLTIG